MKNQEKKEVFKNLFVAAVLMVFMWAFLLFVNFCWYMLTNDEELLEYIVPLLYFLCGTFLCAGAVSFPYEYYHMKAKEEEQQKDEYSAF